MARHLQIRQLLAQTRTLLADQGSLGLVGLDVGPNSLRLPPPVQPAPSPFASFACLPPAVPPAGQKVAAGPLALQQVERDLGPCTRCRLAQTRQHLVFGAGSAGAQLVFVGEGPGRDEDRLGEPFVGEAGRLLNRMLAAMKLSREAVYITNVVKCRPPDNRFPEPDEQASCSPFLWRQLAAIRPQVVVALGRLASHTLLEGRAPISKVRGQWHQAAWPQDLRDAWPLAVMPTYHPAYLLRRPEDKILVWRDLQAVMARLAAANL